jgi:hypothetical protein
VNTGMEKNEYKRLNVDIDGLKLSKKQNMQEVIVD